MSASKDGADGSNLGQKLKKPFHDLRVKFQDTHLNDVKASLINKKHQIGKFENLFNPQHRHDEESEKACDEKRSRIADQHRFKSYFPERDGNLVKWYVDGRDYFWAVSEALEQAKETIYIEDWWLSPELFLRRPPYFNQEWRLDAILKRRAEAGVKIYIMVYREVEAALACNSAHTKRALQSLCPKGSPGYGNIKIMRHPDHNVLENAADMTFYWAHHEKFIIIDYAMAFIGGLDLCFGRWDNHQHTLSDIHPEDVANEVWPGQDFNNNRVMDFKDVYDWEQNELSKAEYGRMPWHDVAMGVIGPCVYDIAEHFVLRWNFVKRDKYKRSEEHDWIMLRGREGEDEDLIGVQRPQHPVGDYVLHPLTPLETKNLENRGSVHAQIVRSSADWSSGILRDASIQHAYIEVIRNAQHYVYIENQFFITATGDQQSPIHNTIGRAIVDACVRAGKEGRKFRVIIIIPAVPGFAGDLRDDAATGTRAIMDYQYKSIVRGEHSIFEQIRAEGVDPTEHIFIFNLRSYDRLNVTPEFREREKKAGVSYQQVQRAQAEEVVGTGLYGNGSPDTPGKRDRHMAKAKQKEIRDPAQSAEAKKRFEEVERNGEAASQTECSVAHHAMAGTGKLSDEPWDGDPDTEVHNWIQEELYIHAKLLIVDDRIVICGSSNLNDRSQEGHHDSELSIVLEDTEKIPSKMDGQSFDAGRLAVTLRRHLWREHMGLLPPQEHDASDDPSAQPPAEDSLNEESYQDEYEYLMEDPLSDELWEQWTTNATKNTEIFRHLFHADPDDHIRTFDDYTTYLPPKGVRPGHIFDRFLPPDDIRKKLDEVKGHLVWMPLDYLKDAQMAEMGLQVNPWTESIYT